MSGMSGMTDGTEVYRMSGETGGHNSITPDIISQSDLVRIDQVTDSENG